MSFLVTIRCTHAVVFLNYCRILVLTVSNSDMSFMELIVLRASYSLPIGVVRCACACVCTIQCYTSHTLRIYT